MTLLLGDTSELSLNLFMITAMQLYKTMPIFLVTRIEIRRGELRDIWNILFKNILFLPERKERRQGR